MVLMTDTFLFRREEKPHPPYMHTCPPCTHKVSFRAEILFMHRLEEDPIDSTEVLPELQFWVSEAS